MAVAIHRSMNEELAEGCSDGKYKKVIQDRGGVVEDSTMKARADLSDTYYGIHEAADKVLGDGTVHRTPDYRPTSPVNPMGIY